MEDQAGGTAGEFFLLSLINQLALWESISEELGGKRKVGTVVLKVDRQLDGHLLFFILPFKLLSHSALFSCSSIFVAYFLLLLGRLFRDSPGLSNFFGPLTLYVLGQFHLSKERGNL